MVVRLGRGSAKPLSRHACVIRVRCERCTKLAGDGCYPLDIARYHVVTDSLLHVFVFRNISWFLKIRRSKILDGADWNRHCTALQRPRQFFITLIICIIKLPRCIVKLKHKLPDVILHWRRSGSNGLLSAMDPVTYFL